MNMVSTTPYHEFLNACLATIDMPEENRYQEALWHKENIEEESVDLKVFKIGSVVLVDSGVAFTPVNNPIELQNVRDIKGPD